MRHAEGSMKRLQTDVIDLYQMHHVDRECPWAETWQAFDALVRKHFGVVYAVAYARLRNRESAEDLALTLGLRRAAAGLSQQRQAAAADRPDLGRG